MQLPALRQHHCLWGRRQPFFANFYLIFFYCDLRYIEGQIYVLVTCSIESSPLKPRWTLLDYSLGLLTYVENRQTERQTYRHWQICISRCYYLILLYLTLNIYCFDWFETVGLASTEVFILQNIITASFGGILETLEYQQLMQVHLHQVHCFAHV